MVVLYTAHRLQLGAAAPGALRLNRLKENTLTLLYTLGERPLKGGHFYPVVGSLEDTSYRMQLLIC